MAFQGPFQDLFDILDEEKKRNAERAGTSFAPGEIQSILDANTGIQERTGTFDLTPPPEPTPDRGAIRQNAAQVIADEEAFTAFRARRAAQEDRDTGETPAQKFERLRGDVFAVEPGTVDPRDFPNIPREDLRTGRTREELEILNRQFAEVQAQDETFAESEAEIAQQREGRGFRLSEFLFRRKVGGFEDIPPKGGPPEPGSRADLLERFGDEGLGGTEFIKPSELPGAPGFLQAPIIGPAFDVAERGRQRFGNILRKASIQAANLVANITSAQKLDDVLRPKVRGGATGVGGVMVDIASVLAPSLGVTQKGAMAGLAEVGRRNHEMAVKWGINPVAIPASESNLESVVDFTTTLGGYMLLFSPSMVAATGGTAATLFTRSVGEVAGRGGGRAIARRMLERAALEAPEGFFLGAAEASNDPNSNVLVRAMTEGVADGLMAGLGFGGLIELHGYWRAMDPQMRAEVIGDMAPELPPGQGELALNNFFDEVRRVAEFAEDPRSSVAPKAGGTPTVAGEAVPTPREDLLFAPEDLPGRVPLAPVRALEEPAAPRIEPATGLSLDEAARARGARIEVEAPPGPTRFPEEAAAAKAELDALRAGAANRFFAERALEPELGPAPEPPKPRGKFDEELAPLRQSIVAKAKKEAAAKARAKKAREKPGAAHRELTKALEEQEAARAKRGKKPPPEEGPEGGAPPPAPKKPPGEPPSRVGGKVEQVNEDGPKGGHFEMRFSEGKAFLSQVTSDKQGVGQGSAMADRMGQLMAERGVTKLDADIESKRPGAVRAIIARAERKAEEIIKKKGGVPTLEVQKGPVDLDAEARKALEELKGRKGKLPPGKAAGDAIAAIGDALAAQRKAPKKAPAKPPEAPSDSVEITIARRPTGTFAERSKSDMNALLMEVDRVENEFLIGGGPLKGGFVEEGAPGFVKFIVGDATWVVPVERLPAFRKSVKGVGSFRQITSPGKLRGPGPVRAKDILPGEVIPLQKFSKAVDKQETELIKEVRSIPALTKLNSLEELRGEVTKLTNAKKGKLVDIQTKLFKAYSDVARSRGNPRPEGPNAKEAADLWDEQRSDWIRDRVDALLAGKKVALAEESFPIKKPRPPKPGEAGFIATDLASAVWEKGKAGFFNLKRQFYDGFATQLTKGADKTLGVDASTRVMAARNDAEVDAAPGVAAIERLTDDLTGRQWEDVVDILDGNRTGRELKPDQTSINAAAELRKVLDAVRNQGRRMGWEIGFIKEYFPHRFQRGPPPGKGAPAPQHQVISGEQLLRENRARTYNLERSRSYQEIEGWRRDKGVLIEYVIDSYKQLAEIKQFGELPTTKAGEPRSFSSSELGRIQHKKIYDIIGQMTDQTDRRFALEGLARITGNEVEKGSMPIIRGARNFAAFQSLSTSAIAQSNQIVHLFTETSGRAVVNALMSTLQAPRLQSPLGGGGRFGLRTPFQRGLVKRAARQESMRSIIASIRGEVAQAAGVTGPLKGFIWGLGKTDQTLRIIADQAARFHIQAAVDKGDAKFLKDMGISGTPTKSDFDRVAKFMADKSQFRAGVQDLPLRFTSETGKMVFQFMSFLNVHSKYIAEISGEAARGHPYRLAKFMAGAMVVGEISRDVRAIMLGYGVMGEDEDFSQSSVLDSIMRASSARRISIFNTKGEFSAVNSVGRALQNIAYVGGIGIWGAWLENIARPGGGERLAGPAIGKIYDLTSNVAFPLVTGGGSVERARESAIRTLSPTLVRRQFQRFIEENPPSRRRTRPQNRPRRQRRRRRRR